MNKGFILNKYSEKIGEFKDANLKSVGLWKLSNVKVNQDYIDILSKATKESHLFILVENNKDSFEVVDSLGVGFMFSDSEVWSSLNDMIFKKACFIESKGYKYEN